MNFSKRKTKNKRKEKWENFFGEKKALVGVFLFGSFWGMLVLSVHADDQTDDGSSPTPTPAIESTTPSISPSPTIDTDPLPSFSVTPTLLPAQNSASDLEPLSPSPLPTSTVSPTLAPSSLLAPTSEPIFEASTSPVSSPTPPPSPTPTPEPLPTKKVIINEIAWMGRYDSEKNKNEINDEWIELYNPNDFEVDLKSYFLNVWASKESKEAGDKEKISIELKQAIPGLGFYLLERTDESSVPEKESDQIYTGALSNEGGYLELKKKKEEKEDEYEMIDSLDFSAGWPGGDNEKKLTLERDDDGKNWHSSSIINGTPKEKNSFFEKVPEENVSLCGEFLEEIILNEILPNPAGIDKNQEWVEVYNPNSKEVELSGWRLTNSSNKSFVLKEGVVLSGNFLKIVLPASFVIKNQKEKISLYDCAGKLSSEVSFQESAGSGISFNRDESGFWRWSRWTTPGEKNRLNNPPEIKLKKIKEIYAGMKIIFDASGSFDRDGEKLKFVWNFGDGHKSYLDKTSHIFEKTGKYEIILQVKDASEAQEKRFFLEVKKYPKRKVAIVKILPNPKGKDTEGELIWLKNMDKKKVDLKGWKVLSGSGEKQATNHPILKKFVLSAGEERALSREESLFVLPNKNGYLALVYPNGKLADEIEYTFDEKSIPEGAQYSLQEENVWQWENLSEDSGAGMIVATEEESVGEVLGQQTEFIWTRIFEDLEKEKTLSWEELAFVDWQKENRLWLEFFPKIF